MLFGVEVVVVVPACDEAPRIGRMIRGLPPEVDRVIVVDDASRDGTREAALAVGDARVSVVVHRANRGVGAAIVTGYEEARRRAKEARSVFVVMAGDDQMDPRDLPALVRPVAESGADYAKGCRFAWPGARSAMPWTRWVGGQAFSFLTGCAIGQPISDSQCGYTAIAGEAVARLDLAGLWPGYGYPNDILGQLAARRMRIVEVPVRPVYQDEKSRLRVRHLPKIGLLVGRAWVRRVRARA